MVCMCMVDSGSVVDPPLEHCTRGGTYYAAGFRSPDDDDDAVLMAGPRKAWTPTAAEPASRRAARRRSRWGCCCCRERAMCKIDLSRSAGWLEGREGAGRAAVLLIEGSVDLCVRV